MSYSITLSFNNETEAFQFPILPESIEVSGASDNKTYTISKLGEINVINDMKLKEVSFEGIFPARWFPACSVKEKELFPPKHYIDLIEKWRGEKKPMRLVMTGSTMNINMLVSVEDFSWSEEAGAVGDINFDISFLEYRSYAAKKAKVEEKATVSGSKKVVMNKNKSAPRPDNRVKPKTYKLAAGDNLWKVAKKFLGDGSKYKEIQKLNGIKDSELKKLPVGKVIKLP